nr:MAG: internal scaffolding protein [Microvirus sp.]
MFYRKHKRVTFNCGDELVTKQHFKEECDIHNILKQYQKTGVITHVQAARPTYADLPDAHDYQEAIHIQMAAIEAFEGLPASVRDHFGNDPGRLLAALHDPAEKDYLTEVGIFRAPDPAPSVPEPVPVPPATPLPSGG